MTASNISTLNNAVANSASGNTHSGHQGTSTLPLSDAYYGVDLHTHSTFSDGKLSPTALVNRAHAQQVHTLALTDHDTIDGLAEAQQAASVHGIRLITGVELSCYWPYTKAHKTKQLLIHIVALNFAIDSPLGHALANLQLQRQQRATLIAHKLQTKLGTDPWPAVLAMAQSNPLAITRPHFAQWLVQQGVVNTTQQAFDKWLGEGKPAYVAMQGLALQQALTLIKASNGVSVYAHPHKYPFSATLLRASVAEFAQYGGNALELPHAGTASGTKDMINRMIQQHQLQVSPASDFHGDHMPWCKLGVVPAKSSSQISVLSLCN